MEICQESNQQTMVQSQMLHLPNHQNSKQIRSRENRPSNKLYVSRIPCQITRDEFHNLFTTVASPTSVFLSDPSSATSKYKWGLVEYSSTSIAKTVIEKLNSAPPYHLEVNYAKLSDRRSLGASYQNSSSQSKKFSDHYSNSHRNSMAPTLQHDSSSSNDNGDIRAKYRNSYNVDNIKNIHLKVSENNVRTVEAEYYRQESRDDYDDISSVANFTTQLVHLGCIVCGSNATKKCPNCNSIYCSVLCASEDWKHHKAICNQNRNVLPAAPRDRRSGGHNQTSQLKNDTSQNFPLKNGNISNKQQSYDTPNKYNSKGPRYKNRTKPVSKRDSDSFSKATGSFEVCVTHIEKNGKLWVVKTSDMKKVDSINSQLSEHCSSTNAERVEKANIDLCCAALFEGKNDWRRAVVCAVNPRLKVHYLDFGNEVILPINNLRLLPSHFSSDEALAHKIKFASNSTLKIEDVSVLSKIFIRKVQAIDDSCTWTVEAEPVTQINDKVPHNQIPQHTSSQKKALVKVDDAQLVHKENKIHTSVSTSKTKQVLLKNTPPLSTECFTKVQITFLDGKSIYWVQKSDDIPSANKLLLKVNTLCMNSTSVNPSDLSPGCICAALFDDYWFRAEVLTVQPAIKVKFIDYGNEEVCPISNIRNLPQDISSIPPYAFKILLAPGTPDKYSELGEGEMLCVKPVSEDVNGWSVHVENHCYDPAVISCHLSTETETENSQNTSETEVAQPVNTETKHDPPLPIDIFTPVVISHVVESGIYWVIQENNLSQITEILNKVDSHCLSPNCKRLSSPAKGTVVSALFYEEWNRAKILSVKPKVVVKFLDFGNDAECSLDQLRDITPELASLPPLAFKVKLSDETPDEHLNLSEHDNLSICPVFQVDSETWLVDVKKVVNKKSPSSSLMKSPVKHEDNSVEVNGGYPSKENSKSSSGDETPSKSKKQPPLPLDSFSKVVITHPVNNSYYWVMRSDWEKDAQEMFAFLNTQCNAVSAERITQVSVGKKCAALKCKTGWSRARVVNNDPLQVKFVDFGNIENVSISDIRQLPSKLEIIKPLAFLIKLPKDISSQYKRLKASSTLSIKLLSKDSDSAWLVSVENVCTNSNTSNLNGSIDSVTVYDKKPNIAFKREIENSDSAESGDRVDLLKPVSPTMNLEANHSFLPMNTFSKVITVFKNSPGDYWVNLHSCLESLVEMTRKLDCCKEEKVKPIIPVVGKTYMCFYYDAWCRAKVISLKPLTILYIDYGNEENVKESELFPLPPEYSSTPPYAIRIQMAEGTSENDQNIDLNSILSVKPISKGSNHVYAVQVEGVQYKDVLLQTPLSSDMGAAVVDHLLEVAVKNKRCDLVVNKVLSNRTFTCTVVLSQPQPLAVPKEIIVDKINRLNMSSNYSGKVGSIVGCKDKEGVVGRACILSVRGANSSAKVALVDYGYESEAVALSPLPHELEQLPPAAVTCKFKVAENDIEVGSVFKCHNLEVKGTKVECSVYGRSECTLSPWLPEGDIPNVPTAELTSGCSVALSAFTEFNHTVYIQPLTEENVMNLKSIILQTCTYCNNAPCVTEEPEEGDLLACQFAEDGQFYRAQILNKSNNKFTVVFLDFGNVSVVSLSGMKSLNEDLKSMPTCAIKVSLEGVEKSCLLPEVKLLLEDYINEKTHFTANFSNLSSIKLELEGQSLNNSIAKILSSKKNPSDRRFMEDCIKYVEWSVGAKLDLFVLATLPQNTLLVLHNKDPNLEFNQGELTDTLSKHAESFASDYSYTPILNELVIACFEEDGLWYRAQCMKEIDDSFEVFFLDFGNTTVVNSAKIRPMTEDHIAPPVIIRKCRVHGVPEVVSKDVQMRLDVLFCVQSLHDVVVSDNSDSVITVYHPHLVSQVKQNLIPLPLISPPKMT